MTPDERLAGMIVDRLVEQRLIPAAKVSEVIEKLVTGTIKIEDWDSWIELAAEAHLAESSHGSN